MDQEVVTGDLQTAWEHMPALISHPDHFEEM